MLGNGWRICRHSRLYDRRLRHRPAPLRRPRPPCRRANAPAPQLVRPERVIITCHILFVTPGRAGTKGRGALQRIFKSTVKGSPRHNGGLGARRGESVARGGLLLFTEQVIMRAAAPPALDFWALLLLPPQPLLAHQSKSSALLRQFLQLH